jgi:cytochrome d ubiquinol oxidase subunit I
VTGILSTAEAVSEVPGGMVATTLAMYLAIYVLLIAAYVSVLFHLANKGVKKGDEGVTGVLGAAAAARGT